MELIGVGFLFMLFGLGGLVLLVWALVELAKRPADQWTRSGHNQLVWALIVVFVGLLGPILYLAIARPALESAASGTTATNNI